jgi:membrane-associated phospholipid phosphatase
MMHVPPAIDCFFFQFDNTVIRACQSGIFSSRLVTYFSLFVTFLTTIELGTSAPLILYIFGLDRLAHRGVMIAFVLATVSQIPKRFLWRYRPYTVGRALQVRRDKTSSFPSRAVTCAVVYAYFMAYAFSGQLFSSATIPAILFSALCASFARVNLGVHYPSDCLFGVLQGVFTCLVGTGFSFAVPMPEYRPEGPETPAISDWSSGGISWTVIVMFYFSGVAVALLSVVPPVRFWQKSHHVFGMLFPSLCFQLTFLYRDWALENSALREPAMPPPPFSYLVAIGLTAFCTIVGAKFKGKGIVSAVGAFSLLFWAVFLILSSWRLYTQEGGDTS